MFNGLISKRDRREQDWWLGRRTSCHWQTEARDHWLEFGFNGDLQTVFAQEPRRRLEPNVWQHLAVTRQGSLLTLYLNGTPVAKQTATAARNKPSQAPVVLGTIQFPWDTANGEERDVGLCLAPIGNDLDPTKTHDVTLEIHPEEPSRRGIWGPFDARGMESVIAKPKYRGKWIRASHLMIRGQIVEE